MRVIPLLLMLVLMASVNGRAEVKTVAVKHHSAMQIADRLQPLLEDGESAVPSDRHILVRADGESLTAVLELIALLDREQQQFLLRGRYRETVHLDSQNARYLSTEEEPWQEQQLRITEGSSGWLQLRRDIPYTRNSLVFSGETSGVARQTDFRSLVSGFSVTPGPLVNGKVSVDIEARISDLKETSAADTPETRSQGVVSQLELPLGQWVTVAVQKSVSQNPQSRVLSTHNSGSESGFIYQLRVDLR